MGKDFVLSIYPEAYCRRFRLRNSSSSEDFFVIYPDRNAELSILFDSCKISEEHAWTLAANHINHMMLRKLEK